MAQGLTAGRVLSEVVEVEVEVNVNEPYLVLRNEGRKDQWSRGVIRH